jgi:hypothetical protein
MEFNQPVGMITKNAGMLRDKDIIKKLAKKTDFHTCYHYHYRRRTSPKNGTKNNNRQPAIQADQRT